MGNDGDGVAAAPPEGMGGGSKHRLRVQRRLGQGAYGMVYKGTYDGAVCAVKTVLRGNDAAGELAYRMFIREAQMLQSCAHRNIIGFRALCRMSPRSSEKTADLLSEANSWALVLEFAKGGTLSDRITAQMVSPGSKTYSSANALRWALDVAEGLKYLHSRTPPVMHRDVKCSNIVLSEDPGRGGGSSSNSVLIAKLSDFGLHMAIDASRGCMLRVSVPQTGGAAGAVTEAAFYPAAFGGGKANKPAAAAVFDSTSSSSTRIGAAAPPMLPSSEGSGRSSPSSKPTGKCCNADDASTSSSGNSNSRREYALPPLPSTSRPLQLTAQEVVQPLQQQQCAARGDEHYGEVHTSGGVMHTYVGAPSTARGVLRTGGGLTDAPRVAGCVAPGSILRSPMETVEPLERQASMNAGACSLGTDCTWITGTGSDASIGGESSEDEYACTSASVSSCGSVHGGRIWNSIATVYDMTGNTGSCLYMAPEVYRNEPYNEKVDVFSFGVVLYELLARCLVLFTELPTTNSDPTIVEEYAAKVAKGYRPKKPRALSDVQWQLVQACWHADPAERPSMARVASALRELLDAESAAKSGLSMTERMASLAGARLPAGNLASASGTANGVADNGGSDPRGCGCVIV